MATITVRNIGIIPTNTTGTALINSVYVSVASVTGIAQSQQVSGVGIAFGTVVASISGNTITLSTPTTAPLNNAQITFYSNSTDPQRGNGLNNFISDLQAVEQILFTRLSLFLGSWYEDITLGTPYFQSLLGIPTTNQGVAVILQTQILKTPYVTGVQNLNVSYVGRSRSLTFSALVSTQFGTIVLNEYPLTLPQQAAQSIA